jgi:hypothetical protein
MKQDEENQGSMHPRDSFNLFLWIVDAHRVCLLPFLRCSFGPQAFGISGLMALGMIFFYGTVGRAPEMFYFMWVWLAAMLIHRCHTAIKMSRGWMPYSFYQGYPLAMKIPFIKSEKSARGVEPFLCAAIGTALCPLSVQIGGFFIFGMFSLAIFEAMSRFLTQVRVRRMHDAMIEQRFYAQELHKFR